MLGLEKCDADALHRFGWTTRTAGEGCTTLESAARGLSRCLYDAVRVEGASDAGRACALVRCYKTHPYRSLPADLRLAARSLLRPGEPATPGMRCVSLLASAGDVPAWNSRHDAGRHRVIPLPTPAALTRWPMVEQLARDFGLTPSDLIEPSPGAVRPRGGRNYGVFHVAEALGSAVIPAQAALVRRFGVRSVIAFGGSLSTGDLFAVVLFCRVLVPTDVAEQFRALALHVKSALFGFGERDVFDPMPRGGDAMGAPC